MNRHHPMQRKSSSAHWPSKTGDPQAAVPAPANPPSRAPLAQLQRTLGNSAVRQLLAARSRIAEPSAPVTDAAPSVAQLAAEASAAPNRTGMPDSLKSGLEQLSGMDLSDVKVHYNSAKPAQVNAHAYAQGSDIHVASGQEKHLPHEGWHIVQQRQGRVQPTAEVGGVAVNDDASLEREADTMGQRAVSSSALQLKTAEGGKPVLPASGGQTVQRALVRDQDILDERTNTFNWVSFRGERNDDDVDNPAVEEGRGAQVGGVNGEVKSHVQWSGVDSQTQEGTSMTAMIGPDHNLGSGPSVKNAVERVQALGYFSGKKYISGHLLNEKLGGPGNDARNLTAISNAANLLEASNIEKHVRDPVNEQGHWYYYNVDIDYEDDTQVYSSTHAKIQGYPKLKITPSGVEIQKNASSGQATVKIRYASRMKAVWYQLNTNNKRYGPKYKRDITIDSPFAGGTPGLDNKGNGDKSPVKPAPNAIKAGTAAVTEIDAEELVLTTGTLLKSVVENREGLIARLNQLRGDQDKLHEAIAELQELVDNADMESEELHSVLRDLGYKNGYDDGVYAVENNVEFQRDDGSNAEYTSGYQDGYNQAFEDGDEYYRGHQDGKDFIYTQGHPGQDNFNNTKHYVDGYWKGIQQASYEIEHKKGRDVGYEHGYADDPFNLPFGAAGPFIPGYHEGYAEGKQVTPYKAGTIYDFHFISLVKEKSYIPNNTPQTFRNQTSVELTGEKELYNGAQWYQVKIRTTRDNMLHQYQGDTAWMKKQWLNKGF